MGLIDSVDLRRDLDTTLPDQLISQIDRVDALRVEDGPVITGITEGRGQYLTAGDADDPLRLLLRFPLAAGRAGPNGVYPDVQLSRHIRADNPAHALRLDRRADDKQLCRNTYREQQHRDGNCRRHPPPAPALYFFQIVYLFCILWGRLLRRVRQRRPKLGAVRAPGQVTLHRCIALWGGEALHIGGEQIPHHTAG